MNFTPRHTLLLVFCTCLLVFGASQFTPPEAGFLGLRRVDIFSELRSDSAICETAGLGSDYELDNEQYAEASADQFTPPAEPTSKPATLPAPAVKPRQAAQPAPIAKPLATADSGKHHQSTPKVAVQSAKKSDTKTLVKIEDFSTGATLTSFFDKLRSAGDMRRPVRIAVLGDSFIEGDIFTQDLRELLQSRFGGRGVGFVPIASGVSGFRQTVGHTFSGWNTNCITSNLQRGGYTISSYTFTPGDGSTVVYKGSKARAHLNHFSRARFMFINRKNSKIKASINGDPEQVFTPSSSNQLQQVVMMGDSIETVKFTIESADGFTGYGSFLDAARGVSVDNFSVRGNSGTTLISTDGELMSQMNGIVPYDLIILEYGLNVAQADVKNYTSYLIQMQSAVAHIRASFPGAAILIMSVPDRSRRTADGTTTMPGIVSMVDVQRQLAQKTGGSFWSTMEAMQVRGGMGEFVKRGWAAKDYTHLSHRGGRELARAFFDALMFEMNEQAQ